MTGKAGDSPTITVITATRNDLAALRLTAHSLLQQTGNEFEWIIIDNESTDGTVEFLSAHENVVDLWISEPDSGIYDAWNKGCREMRGQWAIFLGAGDVLATRDVFARVVPLLMSLDNATTVAYGQLRFLSPNRRVELDVIGEPWDSMARRWEIGRPALPPHGATFHRASLLSSGIPFDRQFRIAADSKLLLQAIRGSSPAYLSMVVTCAPIGGISYRWNSAREVAREVREINRQLGISPPVAERAAVQLRLLAITLVRALPVSIGIQLADFLRRLLRKAPRWTID